MKQKENAYIIIRSLVISINIEEEHPKPFFKVQREYTTQNNNKKKNV